MKNGKADIDVFHRLLHASYWRGSSSGLWFKRRLGASGGLMLGLTAISALLGLNVEQARVFLVFGLLISMIFVALFWVWLRRGEMTVKRELPEYASAGEKLSYVVSFENTGRRTLRSAWLRESEPDTRPSLWEFFSQREPRENQRNGFDRRFAYYRWRWLVERGGIFEPMEKIMLSKLKKGEKGRARLSLLPLRRGVIQLKEMRLFMADPFGFFQRCQKAKGSEGSLLVLPKRYHLPETEFTGEIGLQSGGEASSQTRSAGGEFLSLRDYRSGDPPRHIHWRSWAKTGHPIVINHEEFWFPRYGLVLDTALDQAEPEIFEEAVSVSASYVSTIDTQKCLLDLMFVREEPRVITAGRGMGKASVLLEVLAMVKSSPPSSYDALRELVLRHGDELTALLVVLTGWSQARADLLNRWAAAGLDVHAIVVCANKKEEMEKAITWPPAMPIKWLRCGQIQEDLLN